MDDVGWLPLGTVVTLNGGSRRVMVVGRVQRDARTGIIYEYGACPWPQGMVDGSDLIVFNHGDVAQVHANGFVDVRETIWQRPLDELRREAGIGSDGLAPKPRFGAGILDRYGGEHGGFLFPEGTSYAERSMPPGTDLRNYHLYQVTAKGSREMRLTQSTVRAWFDQPGGGTQYYIPQGDVEMEIKTMIDQGWIEKIL